MKPRPPEYFVWVSMRRRCLCRTYGEFPAYGGRGITICERWRNSFENFYGDMGPRPTASHSIDRIDNNKGYSPDNCRWATMREQSVNKRNTRLITLNGQTKCLAHWARQLGISRDALTRQVDRGASESTILNLKPRRYRDGRVTKAVQSILPAAQARTSLTASPSELKGFARPSIL